MQPPSCLGSRCRTASTGAVCLSEGGLIGTTSGPVPSLRGSDATGRNTALELKCRRRAQGGERLGLRTSCSRHAVNRYTSRARQRAVRVDREVAPVCSARREFVAPHLLQPGRPAPLRAHQPGAITAQRSGATPRATPSRQGRQRPAAPIAPPVTFGAPIACHNDIHPFP